MPDNPLLLQCTTTKQYLAGEQDAPTALPRNKHCRTIHYFYNAPPPSKNLTSDYGIQEKRISGTGARCSYCSPNKYCRTIHYFYNAPPPSKNLTSDYGI
ncbi:MAG: hypothetical protein F6K40_28195 [Okeania sp. SIO3I5]|uniref:hypothetical protein n=1 Tax=Okeania sp. SIO3I5 TaxID=2607805 RepID=UPI0013B75858|nr:hypothetical protein [Okeania sp. SIO3I5]NEQ39915.1 hypothetical protein [Okeania sp. SIO3I5]